MPLCNFSNLDLGCFLCLMKSYSFCFLTGCVAIEISLYVVTIFEPVKRLIKIVLILGSAFKMCICCKYGHKIMSRL